MDVDVEDAYFTGDEAPGGDNPTPDQDIVDDIGKALGVEYQDNEELKAVDKVKSETQTLGARPASSEDYKERDEKGLGTRGWGLADSGPYSQLPSP